MSVAEKRQLLLFTLDYGGGGESVRPASILKLRKSIFVCLLLGFNTLAA